MMLKNYLFPKNDARLYMSFMYVTFAVITDRRSYGSFTNASPLRRISTPVRN